MKIDLHYSRRKPGPIEVYQRCGEAFRERGIDCRFHPDRLPASNSDADLFVIYHHTFLGPHPEKLGRPIVYEEWEDSAMPNARGVLSLPNVIKFFKGSMVRHDWVNLPNRRVHTWLLEREAKWQDRQILTEKDILKIESGFNFGMYNRMQKWIERARKRVDTDNWTNRPIDALFIGQTDYKIPALRRHRLRFCEAMRSIQGLNVVLGWQRSVRMMDYFELCHHAKIIVSPWGYGELCYRDFEAWLDDCVLVKPRTDFIRVLGSAFVENETYVPCQIDAIDLEEVIHSVLSSDLYRDLKWRRRNRERVIAWWDEKRLVEWWCQQMGFDA